MRQPFTNSMFGRACGFLVLLVLGSACSGAEEPSQTQISQWVDQLGDREFAVRDRATSALSGLDADHLPFLIQRLEGATDPEVTVRLRGVIAKLKFERQQSVIRAFLRDADMEQSHELEGWNTFASIAGRNRSSKRLFLELYERYPELVEKPLNDAQQAFDAAVKVSRTLQESEIQFNGGDATDGLALLYCLCIANLHGDHRLAVGGLRVFGRFPYNKLIRDPQAKRPMEVMVERWASSLATGADLTSALLIMLESDLATARTVAIKLLSLREGPDRASPEDLLIGMQVMFRLGTRDDLPVLEPWLEDKELCVELSALDGPIALPPGFGGPPGGVPLPSDRPPMPNDRAGQVIRTLELRDAALLACMRITGMEYRDYFPGIRLQEPRGYLPNSILLSPSDDERRQRRIDAWKASLTK